MSPVKAVTNTALRPTWHEKVKVAHAERPPHMGRPGEYVIEREGEMEGGKEGGKEGDGPGQVPATSFPHESNLRI